MVKAIAKIAEMKFSVKSQRLLAPYLLGSWLLFVFMSAYLPCQAAATELAKPASDVVTGASTRNQSPLAGKACVARSCTGDVAKPGVDNCCKDDFCHATPDLALESFQVESGMHVPIVRFVRPSLMSFPPSFQAHALIFLARPPRYPQSANLQLRLLI